MLAQFYIFVNFINHVYEDNKKLEMVTEVQSGPSQYVNFISMAKKGNKIRNCNICNLL